MPNVRPGDLIRPCTKPFLLIRLTKMPEDELPMVWNTSESKRDNIVSQAISAYKTVMGKPLREAPFSSGPSCLYRLKGSSQLVFDRTRSAP